MLVSKRTPMIDAIWATLINGRFTYCQFKDAGKGLSRVVYRLGCAYTCLEVEAPSMAIDNAGGKAIPLVIGNTDTLSRQNMLTDYPSVSTP